MVVCGCSGSPMLAVRCRLTSHAPLLAALPVPPQVRHIKESTNAFDKDHKLHTYSIGIKGAPLPLPLPPLPLLPLLLEGNACAAFACSVL